MTSAPHGYIYLDTALVHLAGLGFEVLVEGNLEVEELVAVGVAQLVEVQLAALERVSEPGDVVKEESRARGVRLDHQGAVLEGVEVLLYLFIAGLGLQLDFGYGAGHGDLGASSILAAHQPFHILGFGGFNPVARGGEEENARVAQRDGPVAVIGHDEAHRHYAVAEVVDAEDGYFLARVVGFGGDGHLLVFVHLDRGAMRAYKDLRSEEHTSEL